MKKESLNSYKDKICKQFLSQMKEDYPSLDLNSVKESFDNWMNNKEAKGIIEMFFFPELDKLIERKLK